MPVRGVFEAHVNVANLDRSIHFYRDVLGLEIAYVVEARRVAFFWCGADRQTMLGVWEVGTTPMKTALHTAFAVDLEAVLAAPRVLREAGITPLAFGGEPTDEPSVIAWMPAAAVFFHDPDRNLLEYIALLPEPPDPSAGVLPWSAWRSR